MLGKRLGVYELEEEIGRGAMGIVYRGRQVTLDRVVAVKVLLENLANDESFVVRFTREARLVASLNHPNIVHVYDAGRAENLLYFAMEYISGPTVGQLLKQRGSCQSRRRWMSLFRWQRRWTMPMQRSSLSIEILSRRI